MSNKKEEKSFWSTLPGILTGIAAVITAIGGIILFFPPNDPTTFIIPNSAGWIADGPGTVKPVEYKDGSVGLNISLNVESYDDNNNYAELRLDLPQILFTGFEQERNPDGTYDLAKTVIKGVVRTDQIFKGDPDNPNIVYFTLSNKKNGNLYGPQIKITDAIMSSAGMDIYFIVPDNSSYKEIDRLSLTFGFKSKGSYNGIIYAPNITISKKRDFVLFH